MKQMSEQRKFHTHASVRKTMEEIQKTFTARRQSVASELSTRGVQDIIPILRRCYPLDGLRISGREIDDSLIKLNVSVEYFRTEMYIHSTDNDKLANNASRLMENVLLNYELYKAATENVEVLNLFMRQFDTPDRIVRYTVDTSAFPIADISDKGVTFAVDVENALFIGNFAFAQKLTLGEDYPNVLDIEYDNEVQEAQKFFTPESIFKVASMYNRINKELGLRIMYSPSTIIKKVFNERSARRPDGYTFKDNVYTVIQDGETILRYELNETEIARRQKAFGGKPKETKTSKPKANKASKKK